MSLSDPGLALLLDPARLSELIGRDVRATHLRPKLGVATVGALTLPEGIPWGWVRTVTGSARAKADKVRRRAAEIGRSDQVGEAVLNGGGTLVQWGPVVTDPRLVPAASLLDPAPAAILRYNPLRRVVARAGERVVRITAHRHRTRLARLATDLSRAGVPVVTSLDPIPTWPASARVSWWPWVEGSDATAALGRPDGPDILCEIGRVLGALHQVEPAAVRDLPVRGWAEALAAARAPIEMLEQVAPGVASSARRVVDLLPSQLPQIGPDVVCHGDLSLDQLLVEASSGTVWLGDLDRAARAPVALDHASLVATALLDSRRPLGSLTAGYVDSTGSPPVAPGAWVAAALLARVAEPWRDQQPGWRAETVRRALLAGRALESDDLWPGRSVAVEVAW